MIVSDIHQQSCAVVAGVLKKKLIALCNSELPVQVDQLFSILQILHHADCLGEFCLSVSTTQTFSVRN